MIPYRSALVRSAALFALCLPMSSLACSGSGFSAGSPDGSSGDDGGDGGGVVVVGDSGGRDATSPMDSGVVDAHHDAHHDGASPEDSGTPVDSGHEDSGGGCPSGFLECVDAGCVASGIANCGTCGNDCANLPHVSGPTSCGASGMCSFPMTSCEPGWADCDGRPDNGCEASTTQSPNCGGCNVTCGSSMPVCNGTACVTGCSGGTPDLCGSTCTNKTTDPQNCSTCGHVCAAGPTNSQASCAGGVCGYTCNSAYSPCNSGCVNEQNDPNNCGTCGKQCTGPANSTVSCTTGSCGWTCDPTFTQCPDSTCDNVNTDVAHCGSSCTDCNTASPPPANGTDVCSSGTCDFTCSAPYVKCAANRSCQGAATTGAYVQAGSGHAAGSCGTAMAPCETLQAGVDFAKQQGLTMVYVADGTYAESIVISSAMTIQGAWTFAGGTWSRDCPPNSASTKIAAPSGSLYAVGTGASPVVLDTLSISNDGPAGAGQTLYGVLVASGQTAQLVDVAVDVKAGGAGGTGSTGANAGSTPATCSASPSTPLVGTTGGAGTGAPAGTYGAMGYGAGFAASGIPGGPGGNGTAAPAPTPAPGYACHLVSSTPFLCDSVPLSSTGTAGTNGCGGLGSNGGWGGFGGGSSIGVYAWGATVTMVGSPGQITVANGGKGGDGGGPGAVGMGSAGSAGQKATQPTCASCNTSSCMTTGCNIYGAAGAVGGTGANGGPGGQGGGGSGGDSYCYVTGSGGSVTTTWPAGFCTFGSGGLGGNQGGSSQGATGSAGVHN